MRTVTKVLKLVKTNVTIESTQNVPDVLYK